MSDRNGDKARFHRLRKKRIIRRERQGILFARAQTVGGNKATAGDTAPITKERRNRSSG